MAGRLADPNRDKKSGWPQKWKRVGKRLRNALSRTLPNHYPRHRRHVSVTRDQLLDHLELVSQGGVSWMFFEPEKERAS